MTLTFIRLHILKAVRSVSLTRNLIGSFFVGLFALIILFYMMLVGFAMKDVLVKGFGADDPIRFLNAGLLSFFILEFLYRFFLQKVPVFELESYLHLPIRRNTIINFMLWRSFFTPLGLVVIILFAPFAFTEIAVTYGKFGAWNWLLVVVLISWSMHWFILYFKVRFGDNIVSIATVLFIGALNALMGYMGWTHPGEWTAPFFEASMSSIWPLVVVSVMSIMMYIILYRFFRENAYTEDIAGQKKSTYVNKSIGFLSRFGLIGAMADLEWKLILRHNKSRSYLILSVIFLLYGLIFYTNDMYYEGPARYMFIFVGIFVTGVFMIQYGQMFLSWNSPNFDFYMSRPEGLEALVRGKYLLFVFISVICFVLTVPYVYFGVEILLVHAATFLFNVGVTIHLVINLALWKPKPMDLNKGAVFNYEGVGLAQYLMIIPMVAIPYMIFVPAVLITGSFYAGLAVLALIGMLGVVFHEKLSLIAVERVKANKYQISTSFRQES